MINHQILFFDEASDFIDTIPEPDKAKVLAAIKMMQTDIEVVYIKMLQKSVKELKVKKYRLIFFIKGNTIFFVQGFVKKSQKTPKYIIGHAQNIYNQMK